MIAKPLAGNVALVTGAARGIGQATAVRLASDGADLVLIDLPTAAMEESLAQIEATGQQALLLTGDVTDSANWVRWIEQAQIHYGKIDILVNNAGVPGVVSPILDYPEEMFDRVLAVNVRGVFLGIKYTGQIMKQQGSGTIINIASVAGLTGTRNISAYTASKHAVIGVTKVAALELARDGIRVNAICPAPIATEMMYALERGQSSRDPEAVRKRFTKSIALQRYGEPSEIAAVVAFLAGPDSSFMTGAAITVDGGMLA